MRIKFAGQRLNQKTEFAKILLEVLAVTAKKTDIILIPLIFTLMWLFPSENMQKSALL